jgi:hypothetical protein
MKKLTIQQRIANFLTTNKPKAFCDDCIARAVGLSQRQQAQSATAAMAAAGYKRVESRCAVCGQIKLVTSA